MDFNQFLKEIKKIKGFHLDESGRIRHNSMKDMYGEKACPICALYNKITKKRGSNFISSRMMKKLNIKDCLRLLVIKCADNLEASKISRKRLLKACGL